MDRFPAVALLGPRQVGKSTLARQIALQHEALMLDLESPADRAKLQEPELFLSHYPDRLLILDEVQRLPGLFEVLRGVIDANRYGGRRSGQFFLLGSASVELIRQSSESLAGRICYLELSGLSVLELGAAASERLWIRGGFPDSVQASDDASSSIWREQFIRTCLERDIPQLGPRIPAETLRRFWTMLAHHQGGLLNAAALGRALGVDGKTIRHYLDLLVDLLLVRQLQPLVANAGKRLVKAPKVYVRDSGLVHTLLGLDSAEAVLGHPVAGASWEGFVIETLLTVMPQRCQAFFYRTAGGAEMDLVIDHPGGERWAIEVKRSLTPTLSRGFHQAQADLNPRQSFVVIPREGRFPLAPGVDAVGLAELAAHVAG
ncbi:ATP-binding protein [Synechococcus sp. CCY9202]|uniref:ATP-binding protein n=1 Tax=Synechococcus sp. CCY9202 TaxID=174698 RepID=UPI002B21D821|nr:ATP-binding protein [Synechococcus sp. CCY9202]MEA5424557.1 ATP-binding protein [Synechococcus sp. CCY9202]